MGQIPNDIFKLSINAIDQHSGISHVTFLWHSDDWSGDDWLIIGEDWDGSDGWGVLFDSTQLMLQSQLAFYAKTYDRAGNWMGTGVWNITNSTWKYVFPLFAK